MKRKLYSIGYTGFSLHDFVKTLADNGVQFLVDTRELPISRKKGFSKSALQTHLLEADIGYGHFRQLGSPRSDRHEVRETGDYGKFFSRVRTHLTTAGAAESVREVIEIAREKTSCLMCCCEDWRRCHRSCVLDAIIARTYFSVEHLEMIQKPMIRAA